MSFSSEIKLDSSIDSLNEKDILKQYNQEKFPFKEILENLFAIESLELLHNQIKSNKKYNADLGKDSDGKYHKIFYKEIKEIKSDLRTTWELFIKDEIRNHFPNEDSIIVQKLPNIRIHIPNGQAIMRWHCDSDKDHRHPLGEINCIMPFTNMYDSNSVWRESAANKNDFKAFILKFGELVYWNGNTCIHGNKVNDTNITRVSFDFRIFLRKEYNKYVKDSENKVFSTATMGTKFIVNEYYKEIF